MTSLSLIISSDFFTDVGMDASTLLQLLNKDFNFAGELEHVYGGSMTLSKVRIWRIIYFKKQRHNP